MMFWMVLSSSRSHRYTILRLLALRSKITNYHKDIFMARRITLGISLENLTRMASAFLMSITRGHWFLFPLLSSWRQKRRACVTCGSSLDMFQVGKFAVVVTALALYQCSPCSIPGLLLCSDPRGFSPGTPFFPFLQKPIFDISLFFVSRLPTLWRFQR